RPGGDPGRLRIEVRDSRRSAVRAGQEPRGWVVQLSSGFLRPLAHDHSAWRRPGVHELRRLWPGTSGVGVRGTAWSRAGALARTSARGRRREERMSETIYIREAVADELSRVRPLWHALYEHQRAHGLLTSVAADAFERWAESLSV